MLEDLFDEGSAVDVVSSGSPVVLEPSEGSAVGGDIGVDSGSAIVYLQIKFYERLNIWAYRQLQPQRRGQKHSLPGSNQDKYDLEDILKLTVQFLYAQPGILNCNIG